MRKQKEAPAVNLRLKDPIYKTQAHAGRTVHLVNPRESGNPGRRALCGAAATLSAVDVVVAWDDPKLCAGCLRAHGKAEPENNPVTTDWNHSYRWRCRGAAQPVMV